MKNLENAVEQINTIRKYATIGNGTALILALTTISKTPLGEIHIPAGRIAIWCFFLGLVSSFLHLLFNMFWVIVGSKEDTEKYLDRVEKGIPAPGSDADSFQAAELRNSVEKLRGLMSSSEFNLPKENHRLARDIQEWLLWTSHGLLFFGLLVVVCSV